MSVYKLSIFTKSLIEFFSGDDKITITVNVDPVPFLRDEESEFDRSDFEEIYEGHIIDPKVLPDWILKGIVGTGTVNGNQGQVKLMNDLGASVAIADQIFGRRIRLGLIRRVSYTSFSEDGG